MTSVEEIRLMNNSTIHYLRKFGKSTKRNEIIQRILSDEACFFKMDKYDAYTILEGVGVQGAKCEQIYQELVSQENYYDLKQRGKIKNDDTDIRFRYDEYERGRMFNREETPKQDVRVISYQKISFFQRVLQKLGFRFGRKEA